MVCMKLHILWQAEVEADMKVDSAKSVFPGTFWSHKIRYLPQLWLLWELSQGE